MQKKSYKCSGFALAVPFFVKKLKKNKFVYETYKNLSIIAGTKYLKPK